MIFKTFGGEGYKKYIEEFGYTCFKLAISGVGRALAHQTFDT